MFYTFHTPYFPHPAFSPLLIFHTPHSASRTRRFPPNRNFLVNWKMPTCLTFRYFKPRLWNFNDLYFFGSPCKMRFQVFNNPMILKTLTYSKGMHSALLGSGFVTSIDCHISLACIVSGAPNDNFRWNMCSVLRCTQLYISLLKHHLKDSATREK